VGEDFAENVTGEDAHAIGSASFEFSALGSKEHPAEDDSTSQFDLSKAKRGELKGASVAILVQPPHISWRRW
jgi:hypothetical protein